MAERDTHLLPGRRQDRGVEWTYLDGPSEEIGPEVAGDAHRIAVAVDERDDCVAIGADPGERVVDGERGHGYATPVSSKTVGSTSVRPFSHHNARRGVISMIDRSKKSGIPKRFLTKLSITGSLARHRGRSRSQSE